MLVSDSQDFWLSHIWKLYYIITLIYRGRWNKESGKRQEFIPIKSEYLRNVIGRDYAKRGFEVLIKLKIIESDRRYIVGQKSIGYRFTVPYANESFKEVTLEKSDIIPADVHSKTRSIIINGFEQEYLFQNLQNVTLDEQINNELYNIDYKTVRNEDYYFRSVEFIRKRDWFFCSDINTGRVFNNITSLPRVLRPYIKLEGRPTVEIDVANCQPLLLLSLYNGEPERQRFEDAVKGGAFYELLNSELRRPYPMERRGKLKEAVFKNILFGRVKENPPKIARTFENLFPVLYSKINAFKTPRHEALAISLQKTEADLIIRNVVGAIAKSSGAPILTVHDSVITSTEFADEVGKVIENAFRQRFGFSPTLKMKRLIESNCRAFAA